MSIGLGGGREEGEGERDEKKEVKEPAEMEESKEIELREKSTSDEIISDSNLKIRIFSLI